MHLRTMAACGLVALTAACASSGSMQDGMPSATMSNVGGTMWSDANVAAVGHASNMDEIETSRLALQRSQNAQVRQYAQQMIDEHMRVDQQMMEMLRAKGMTMQPNEVAQAAMQATRQTLANLSRRSGMDFDRAYMEHQVMSHRWTLTSLDRTLIPATRDAQMKGFLATTVRPAVAMHLQMAERMMGSMGGATSGTMDHSGHNTSGTTRTP
jgi:putative membrane protein